MHLARRHRVFKLLVGQLGQFVKRSHSRRQKLHACSFSKPGIAGDLHEALGRRGAKRQFALDHLLELAVRERLLRRDQLATDPQKRWDARKGFAVAIEA
jgi:hypothetical protein